MTIKALVVFVFIQKHIMCYLDAAIISVRSRRQSNRQNNRQAQTANPSDVHFTTSLR